MPLPESGDHLDPKRSKHNRDPYFYARSRGPNLYDDREYVFNHVDPFTFIDPAMEVSDVTRDDLSDVGEEVVLYATQLAIGTHRPNFVRDLEETAFEEVVEREREEREQRLREKYGDRLDDTVQMGGFNWPIELADDFAEQMGRFANLPVVDDKTADEERPKEYRRPDGTHVILVDEDTFDALTYMTQNPDPYHPHHGYRLSIEHDHLAAATAGRRSGIKMWDWGTKKKPGTYTERYEAFFTPDFFIDLALKQLMIDPANLNEAGRLVAHRAVQDVLLQFGEETRQRHAAEAGETPTEDSHTIAELDLDRVQKETDRQTDFENIRPEDFV